MYSRVDWIRFNILVTQCACV